MAPTIPQGTAVAALEASSLICTLESNEPEGLMNVRCLIRIKTGLPIAHAGARKLRMKANPLGQPFTDKITIRGDKESSIQHIQSVNSQRAN